MESEMSMDIRASWSTRTRRAGSACPLALLIVAVVALATAEPVGSGQSPASAPVVPREGCAAEVYREGMRQFAERDLAAAARSFRRATGDGQGYLALCGWNMLGQTSRLLGDFETALEAFGRVEAAAPAVSSRASGAAARNAAVLGELAMLYQAEILEEQEKWPAALQRYERLLGGGDAPGRLAHDPYCRERIARLYWRSGQPDRAVAMLRAILADTPDYPRAAMLQLAVLSLDLQVNSGDDRLPWLSAPLTAGGAGAAPAAEPPGQQADPLNHGLAGIIADQPSGSRLLPALCLRHGWVLLQAGQPEAAVEQFRAASSLADGSGATQAVVKGYADLSAALWCLRQGQMDKAARLAEPIVAAGGHGHLQEVATQVITALGWYRSEQNRMKKCAVRPLQ